MTLSRRRVVCYDLEGIFSEYLTTGGSQSLISPRWPSTAPPPTVAGNTFTSEDDSLRLIELLKIISVILALFY